MSIPSGNDPFSGSSVQNLLQHTISPKIVSDGSTGYVVKNDLINIDNIYITGTVNGPNVAITPTYLEYIPNSPGNGNNVVLSSGTVGVVPYPNISTPTITSGKKYLMSANLLISSLLGSPATGDTIWFTVGTPSVPAYTNIQSSNFYPYEPYHPTSVVMSGTLTGIFVSDGTVPTIYVNYATTTSLSSVRSYTIRFFNFGCIQLN